jgi:hypothetical protein
MSRLRQDSDRYHQGDVGRLQEEAWHRLAELSARIDPLIASYSAARLSHDQERIERVRAEMAAFYRECSLEAKPVRSKGLETRGKKMMLPLAQDELSSIRNELADESECNQDGRVDAGEEGVDPPIACTCDPHNFGPQRDLLRHGLVGGENL